LIDEPERHAVTGDREGIHHLNAARRAIR
jgi:hypothetical protein